MANTNKQIQQQEQQTSRSLANQKGVNIPTQLRADERPAAVAQAKLQSLSDHGPKGQAISQLQAKSVNSPHAQRIAQLQDKANATAAPSPGVKSINSDLPAQLQQNMEAISGVSLAGTRVHTNSSAPAQLNAHAYAQGSDIHLASGQEKHLPHEAWHVVQQKQDRVQPTKQMKGKTAINDDAGLEREADVMGAKAASMTPAAEPAQMKNLSAGSNVNAPVQMQKKDHYKGGAELELSGREMSLTLSNLPQLDNDKEDKALNLAIGKAIKGIEIDTFNNKSFRGEEWALTIETTTFEPKRLDDSSIKANVRVELILGGSTGSYLKDLPEISKEAAEYMSNLKNQGIFGFKDFGLRAKEHYNKIRENWGLEDPGINWENIEASGAWLKGLTKHNMWQTQITLGLSLDDIDKAKSVMNTQPYNGSMTDEKLGDTINALDILKAIKPGRSEEKDIKSKSSRKLVLNELLLNSSSKHLHLANRSSRFENIDYINDLGDVLTNNENERKEDILNNYFERYGDDLTTEYMTLDTFKGLARVLSSYVRGADNDARLGPKHTMILATKNPLQDIVKSSFIYEYKDKNFEKLLAACAKLIREKLGDKKWKWLDQKNNNVVELDAETWASALVNNKKDLIGEYETRYRYGQVGTLRSLNDVGNENDSPIEGVPVIEFRDAGNYVPDKMEAYFNALYDKL